MATYAKKKKGQFASFPVFQDEPQTGSTMKNARSGLARLRKSKTMGQVPRSTERNDDESIDELAGEALLKDVPQHLMRTASLHSELLSNNPSRSKSSRSTQSATSGIDKPLPPVPVTEPEARHEVQTRTALAPKSKNLKVRRDGQAPVNKPKISPPILQSTASSAVDLYTRPATTNSVMNLSEPHSHTTDPAILEQKISHLMQQAAAQEVESKQREAFLKTQLAKPSPRQRAKNVFMKAGRAIRNRWSSGSSNGKQRQCKLSPISPSASVSADEEPIMTLEKKQSNVPSVQMAQAANLSNPKIQSLTGHAIVPRKVLPVYESMRSRSQCSELEDPFSDDKQAIGRLTTSNCTGFDFDFGKAKHKSKAKKDELSRDTFGQLDGGQRFTNKLSGLGQHPDTMSFTSSPEATSTPQGRLDVVSIASNPNMGGLVKSPSILDFSFEAQSDDEVSVAASPVSKTATDGSQSVKRKSAQENLRSRNEAMAKKVKISTRTSYDMTASIVGDLTDPGTDDERAPMSPRNQLLRKPVPARHSNKKTGLNIFGFDQGKGKAVMAEDEDTGLGTQRRQASMSKRPSVLRPASMIVGRESRNGYRKFSQLDGGEVDVDELAE